MHACRRVEKRWWFVLNVEVQIINILIAGIHIANIQLLIEKLEALLSPLYHPILTGSLDTRGVFGRNDSV